MYARQYRRNAGACSASVSVLYIAAVINPTITGITHAAAVSGVAIDDDADVMGVADCRDMMHCTFAIVRCAMTPSLILLSFYARVTTRRKLSPATNCKLARSHQYHTTHANNKDKLWSQLAHDDASSKS